MVEERGARGPVRRVGPCPPRPQPATVKKAAVAGVGAEVGVEIGAKGVTEGEGEGAGVVVARVGTGERERVQRAARQPGAAGMRGPSLLVKGVAGAGGVEAVGDGVVGDGVAGVDEGGAIVGVAGSDFSAIQPSG